MCESTCNSSLRLSHLFVGRMRNRPLQLGPGKRPNVSVFIGGQDGLFHSSPAKLGVAFKAATKIINLKTKPVENVSFLTSIPLSQVSQIRDLVHFILHGKFCTLESSVQNIKAQSTLRIADFFCR